MMEEITGEISRDDLSRLLTAAEKLNDGAFLQFTKSVSAGNEVAKEIPAVKFCGWCQPDFSKVVKQFPDKWVESSACGNHIRDLKLLN